MSNKKQVKLKRYMDFYKKTYSYKQYGEWGFDGFKVTEMLDYLSEKIETTQNSRSLPSTRTNKRKK